MTGATMSERQLDRVCRICHALPGTTEKISHGEPTFFVAKKVYVMFANNHHGDGHVAVWLPVPVGTQSLMIQASPKKYFDPPYVGVRGWIGIELARVTDKELTRHVHQAWRLIAPKKLRADTQNLNTNREPRTQKPER